MVAWIKSSRFLKYHAWNGYVCMGEDYFFVSAMRHRLVFPPGRRRIFLLPAQLHIHPCICPPIRPSICLSVCLFLRLTDCLIDRLPVTTMIKHSFKLDNTILWDGGGTLPHLSGTLTSVCMMGTHPKGWMKYELAISHSEETLLMYCFLSSEKTLLSYILKCTRDKIVGGGGNGGDNGGGGGTYHN